MITKLLHPAAAFGDDSAILATIQGALGFVISALQAGSIRPPAHRGLRALWPEIPV
jgi:hypothetical protein